MRLLGIDFGTKRIGVAIGDTVSKIASAIEVVKNDSKTIETFVDLVKKESVGAIVIGMPQSMRGGSDGEIADAVRVFGTALALATQLPIHFEDERFSTDLALRFTRESGGDRDAVAAAVILQSYFDKYPRS